MRSSFALAVVMGLAGCLGGQGSINLNAVAQPGANPGPDGQDRAVTVQVLQLAATEAFQSADYFALQNAVAALGGDVLAQSEIALAPNGSSQLSVETKDSAMAVGLVAGLRNPSGRNFRALLPLSNGNVSASIAVNSQGLMVQ